MRITFVVSYLELTGGHLAVLEIASRLAERGHDVVLLYPARSILSRRNALLRRAGVPLPERFFSLNGDRLDWFDFPGRVVRVPDLDPRYAPPADVVIATAWQTAERVASFPASAGRKVYFIQHYETWSGPTVRVDATWRSDFVRVASSDWLRRLAEERFGIRDVRVVPYGVDVARFRPDPAARSAAGPSLRIGFMYHVERWKGVGEALAAIAAAARTRAVRPVAFGVFPRRDDLPSEVEYHEQPSRDELPRIYASLDVFLCASWTETGPMTVPEAMACGTCVVSTDVGNVSLWTAEGEGAFVVPPREPAALAAAVARALDEPAERARRAARGLELVRRFTWDAATDRFERILEESV